MIATFAFDDPPSTMMKTSLIFVFAAFLAGTALGVEDFQAIEGSKQLLL